MRRTVSILTLALLAGVATVPAQAQDNAACAAMVGVWLTTIGTSGGEYASRSLVTVNADGTLQAIDSAQNQGLQGSSFSSQPGVWRCTEAGKASARTLNFGFPPRDSIARSDWTLSLDGAALSGSIALHIFPGVKGVDPFRTDSKPVDTFRFTAQKVSPP